MPVDPSSGYAGISTMFDLNNQASERVSSMTLSAVLSDQPLPTYSWRQRLVVCAWQTGKQRARRRWRARRPQ
jgi:hypothetical protein